MMLMGNTALAYEKLQRGAAGLQVLTMQQALSSLGFSIDTDGKYGPATQRVVKAFQQKYGLKVDGVAGNQTLGLLYSLAPGSGAQTAAPAQNTAAMPEPSGVTATVSTPGGSLNLREKASGSARILTTIPQGGKVQGDDEIPVLRECRRPNGSAFHAGPCRGNAGPGGDAGGIAEPAGAGEWKRPGAHHRAAVRIPDGDGPGRRLVRGPLRRDQRICDEPVSAL